MKRFYSLNDYFQDHFGEKYIKFLWMADLLAPIETEALELEDVSSVVRKEVENSQEIDIKYLSANRRTIGAHFKKFPTGRVIAYFQNFTNTYADVDTLRKRYEEALTHPRVMGLAIATRPDCLGEEVLHLLEEFQQKLFMG